MSGKIDCMLCGHFTDKDISRGVKKPKCDFDHKICFRVPDDPHGEHGYVRVKCDDYKLKNK